MDKDKVPAVSLESLDYLLHDRNSINLSEIPRLTSNRDSASSDDEDAGIKILNTFSLAKNVSKVKAANLTSDEIVADEVVNYDHIDGYAITSFRSEEVADTFDQCLKCDDNVSDMGSEFQLFRLLSSYKAQARKGLQPVLEPDLIATHKKKGFRGLNGRMRKFDRIFARSLIMKNLVFYAGDEDFEHENSGENVDSNSTLETSYPTNKTPPITIKEEVVDDDIWAKIERDSQQPNVDVDVDSVFHSKQLDELLQQESVQSQNKTLKVKSVESVTNVRFRTPSTQSSYIKTFRSVLNRKKLADATENIETRTHTLDRTDTREYESYIDVNSIDVLQPVDTSSIHSKLLHERRELSFVETITRQHAQASTSALRLHVNAKSSSIKRPLVYNSKSVCTVPEFGVLPHAGQKHKIVTGSKIPQKVNKVFSQPTYNLSNIRKTLAKQCAEHSFHKDAIREESPDELKNSEKMRQKILSSRHPPTSIENNNKPSNEMTGSSDSNTLKYPLATSTEKLLKRSKKSRILDATTTSNDMESDQNKPCSRVVPYHSARRSCGAKTNHIQKSDTSDKESKSEMSPQLVDIPNVPPEDKKNSNDKKLAVGSVLQSGATGSTEPTGIVTGNLWSMFAIVRLPEVECSGANGQKAASWMGCTRVFKILSHCNEWIKHRVAILRVILSMDLNLEKCSRWYASAEMDDYFVEILLRTKGKEKCYQLLPSNVARTVNTTKRGRKLTLSLVQIYKKSVRNAVMKKHVHLQNNMAWRQMLEIDRLQLVHSFFTDRYGKRDVPEILGFEKSCRTKEGKKCVKKYHLARHSLGGQIKNHVVADNVSHLCKNIIMLSKISSVNKASKVERSQGKNSEKKTANIPEKVMRNISDKTTDKVEMQSSEYNHSSSASKEISHQKSAPKKQVCDVSLSKNVAKPIVSVAKQVTSHCGSILPSDTFSRVYQYDPVIASNKFTLFNAKKVHRTKNHESANSKPPLVRPIILGKRCGVERQRNGAAKFVKRDFTDIAVSSCIASSSIKMTAKVTNNIAGLSQVLHAPAFIKLAPKPVTPSSSPSKAKITNKPCNNTTDSGFSKLDENAVQAKSTDSSLPSQNNVTSLNIPVDNPTTVHASLITKPSNNLKTSTTFNLRSDGLKYTLVPVTNIGGISVDNFVSNARCKKRLVVQSALLKNAGGTYSFGFFKVPKPNTSVGTTPLTQYPSTNAQFRFSIGESLCAKSTITGTKSVINMPPKTIPTDFSENIPFVCTSINRLPNVSQSPPPYDVAIKMVHGTKSFSASLPNKNPSVNTGPIISASCHSNGEPEFPGVNSSSLLPSCHENFSDSWKNVVLPSLKVTSSCIPSYEKQQSTVPVTTVQNLNPQNTLSAVVNNTSSLTNMISASSGHIDNSTVLSYLEKASGIDAMSQTGKSKVGNIYSSVKDLTSTGSPVPKMNPIETSKQRSVFDMLDNALMETKKTLVTKDNNDMKKSTKSSIGHNETPYLNIKDYTNFNSDVFCSLSQPIVAHSSTNSNLCDTEKHLLKNIQNVRMSSKIETEETKQNVSLRAYSIHNVPKGRDASPKTVAKKMQSTEELRKKYYLGLETMSPEISRDESVEVSVSKTSAVLINSTPSMSTKSFASQCQVLGTPFQKSTDKIKEGKESTDCNIPSTDCSVVPSDDDLLSYDDDSSCILSPSSSSKTVISTQKPSTNSLSSLVQQKKGNAQRLALRRFSCHSKKQAIQQAMKSLTQAEISKFNVECLVDTARKSPVKKSYNNQSNLSGSKVKLRVRMTKNTALKLLNQSRSNKPGNVPLKVLNNTTLTGRSLLDAVGFAASKKSKMRIRMKRDTANHVTGLGVVHTSKFKSSDMLGSYAKQIFGAIVKKVSQNAIGADQGKTTMEFIKKLKKASTAPKHQFSVQESKSSQGISNVAHSGQNRGGNHLPKSSSQNNIGKKYYAKRSSTNHVKEFLEKSLKSITSPQNHTGGKFTLENSNKTIDSLPTSLSSCSTSPSKTSLIKVNVPDDVLKLLQTHTDILTDDTTKVMESPQHTNPSVAVSESRNLFDDIMSSMDMLENDEHTLEPIKNGTELLFGHANEECPEVFKNVFDTSTTDSNANLHSNMHNDLSGSVSVSEKNLTPPNREQNIGVKDAKINVGTLTTIANNCAPTAKNVLQIHVDDSKLVYKKQVNVNKYSNNTPEFDKIQTQCTQDSRSNLSYSVGNDFSNIDVQKKRNVAFVDTQVSELIEKSDAPPIICNYCPEKGRGGSLVDSQISTSPEKFDASNIAKTCTERGRNGSLVDSQISTLPEKLDVSKTAKTDLEKGRNVSFADSRITDLSGKLNASFNTAKTCLEKGRNVSLADFQITTLSGKLVASSNTAKTCPERGRNVSSEDSENTTLFEKLDASSTTAKTCPKRGRYVSLEDSENTTLFEKLDASSNTAKTCPERGRKVLLEDSENTTLSRKLDASFDTAKTYLEKERNVLFVDPQITTLPGKLDASLHTPKTCLDKGGKISFVGSQFTTLPGKLDASIHTAKTCLEKERNISLVDPQIPLLPENLNASLSAAKACLEKKSNISLVDVHEGILPEKLVAFPDTAKTCYKKEGDIVNSQMSILPEKFDAFHTDKTCFQNDKRVSFVDFIKNALSQDLATSNTNIKSYFEKRRDSQMSISSEKVDAFLDTDKTCVLDDIELNFSNENVDVVGIENTRECTLKKLSSLVKKRCDSKRTSDTSRKSLHVTASDKNSTARQRVFKNTRLSSSDEDVDVVGIGDDLNPTSPMPSGVISKRAVSKRTSPSVSDFSQSLETVNLTSSIQFMKDIGLSSSCEEDVDVVGVEGMDEIVDRRKHNDLEKMRRSEMREKYRRLKDLVGGESKISILNGATTKCKDLKRRSDVLEMRKCILSKNNAELRKRIQILTNPCLSEKTECETNFSFSS